MARRLREEPLDETFRAMLSPLRQGFANNFERRVGSTGMAWPPRKDSLDHPLLILSGALLAAVTGTGAGSIEVIEARELRVGVDKSVDIGGIPGAAVHNFGFPDRNIPQREYLYASADTLDQCAAVLVEGAYITVFVF